MSESLSFFARLFLAFRCFFRVLLDGVLASRVARALEAGPVPVAEPKPLVQHESASALQLLALLQREGRLVDFLQQDVSAFGDADVGAAARVVHDGCKKALGAHAEIAPIRSEEEGSTLTLEAGFDAQRVKLTGNVGGKAPHRGILRHRGWRAERLSLPKMIEGHDPAILAPAEIEL